VNTIVVGADASDRSRDPIAFARRFSGAELVLACAVPPEGEPPPARSSRARV
jgi:hypothetical protein